MQSRSYHRVGNYDCWFGYEDPDTNCLRIEWFGEGRRIFEVKLKPESLLKWSDSGLSKIAAKTRKGFLAISRSSEGLVRINIKRWFIPVFRVSGEESGFKVRTC